jgi:chromate reductase, NAD(P)H dehydrogenase (quinone)
MAQLKILSVCGSLRKGSFNRMVLRLAAEVAPPELVFEEASIRDLPHFDGDELAKGFPPSAAEFREKVRAADGLFFAAPEYNFSVSGVMKNAIDWASRGTDQPFVAKPVTVISATMGPLGGGRMQYDLRKILQLLEVFFMPKPETFIGLAQTKFDAEGRCTDDATRKFVTAHMAAFRDWVLRIKKLG